MEIELAKEAIRRMDKAYFEERARRFADLREMRDFTDIKEPVKSILFEAHSCYSYLFFGGTIQLSATALEYTLKMILTKKNGKYKDHSFRCLIDLAKESGYLNDEQSKKAHELRRLRNTYTHYDQRKMKKLSKQIKINFVFDDLEAEDIGKDYLKELEKQLQIEAVTPGTALKCLKYSYELNKFLHKNFGQEKSFDKLPRMLTPE